MSVSKSLIRIRSPNRPFDANRAAKRALREHAETVRFPDDKPHTALVSARPPADVLHDHELQVDGDPEEVWRETTQDVIYRVYEDQVKRCANRDAISGVLISVDPETFRDRATSEQRFQRLD